MVWQPSEPGVFFLLMLGCDSYRTSCVVWKVCRTACLLLPCCLSVLTPTHKHTQQAEWATSLRHRCFLKGDVTNCDCGVAAVDCIGNGPTHTLKKIMLSLVFLPFFSVRCSSTANVTLHRTGRNVMFVIAVTDWLKVKKFTFVTSRRPVVHDYLVEI